NGSHDLNGGLVEMKKQLPSQDEIDQLIQGLSDTQQAVNLLQDVVSQSGVPPELVEQVDALNDAVNQVQPKAIGAIGSYTEINQALAGESGLIQGSSKLVGGIDNVISGTETATEITDQLPQLVDAINQLDANSDDLREGSTSLVEGTEIMSNQLRELESGVSQLADGASDLNEGAGKLVEGSSELGDGIATLQGGTEELADKLFAGAETLDNINTTDANYDMLASPIILTEKETSEVPNYGHALAPMFISLGLYIGALAFNLIFPLSGSAV